MELPDPKCSFFSKLITFQPGMFERIHWILTSPDGRTKNAYNRSMYVEVHCAVIEYENGKAKAAHYLV